MSRLLFWGVGFPFSAYLTFYVANKLWLSGGTFSSPVRMSGKTAIVTGANRGIGRATAAELARRGARVILACRSEEQGAAAAESIARSTSNSNVLSMTLDLSSFNSVRRFVDQFVQQEKRLDILINNAGALFSGHERAANGLEATIMTNHFGHFYLTTLLLDELKKSGPGSRIVTVSSFAYMFANSKAFQNFDELLEDGLADFDNSQINDIPFPYGMIGRSVKEDAHRRNANSKLANVLFAKRLAQMSEETGVASYVVHPGLVRTVIADSLLRFTPFAWAFKSEEQGAQTSVRCAVDEELATQSGLYYSDCRPQELATPQAKDDELAERFWSWSERVVEEKLQAENKEKENDVQ